MQLIQAIAKSQPRQVTTKYGEKTVIDAVGQNGEEITIWRGGNDNSPAVRSIANGSRIAVGLDSKGKYSLLETPADRLPQPVEISPVVTEPTKPMGFHVTAPFEAEQRLRTQIAAASPSQALPKVGLTALNGKVEAVGDAFTRCLAIAEGNHTTALALLDRVLALGF
jgi:hypothetical protein